MLAYARQKKRVKPALDCRFVYIAYRVIVFQTGAVLYASGGVGQTRASGRHAYSRAGDDYKGLAARRVEPSRI